jgi:hypothetical protein
VVYADGYDPAKLSPTFEPTLMMDMPAKTTVGLTMSGIGTAIQGALQGAMSGATAEAPESVEITKALEEFQKTFEQTMGISVEEFSEMMDGQVALGVSKIGLPPELALVFEASDEEMAQKFVDGALAAIGGAMGGSPTEGTRGDLTVQEVASPTGTVSGTVDEGIGIFAVGDGIYDSRAGSADSLGDSELWSDLSDEVGVPDEVNSLFFVDLNEVMADVNSLSGMTGASIDEDVTRRISLVDLLAAWGEVDGSVASFGFYMQVDEVPAGTEDEADA